MGPHGSTTLDVPSLPDASSRPPRAEAPALVLVWAPQDGARLGEVLFPRAGATFGRGPIADDRDERVGLVRQRPGHDEPTPPLDNPFLSRRQVRFERSDDAIRIEAVGKRAIRVGGVPQTTAEVQEGDYVEIEGLYGFACVRRPVPLPDAGAELAPRAFGAADACGVVGESAAAWALRARLVFVGRRSGHVLITGPSGTGKELAAQALHRLSTRAKKELVARNAATFPAGLIDAELFGNLHNYPNPGMPERPGLIGQADGSTLFLDEIGELPLELQAHLLRVLDGGEYQRLGDSRRRVADLRLIAATNRPAESLKEDLAARLGLRVDLPGLDERREDIPLIARHLLLRAAARDPELGQRFCEGWDGARGEPRLSSGLVRALLTHGWSTHVRELDALLMRSAATSPDDRLELTDEVLQHVKVPPRPAAREIAREDIMASLARHGGVKDKVWRELGLPSRFALHRLMKKLGVGE